LDGTTQSSLSIVSIVPCLCRTTSHNFVIVPSERVDLLAAAGDNSANDRNSERIVNRARIVVRSTRAKESGAVFAAAQHGAAGRMFR
jgi:hypothetical protein